jgi:hypothetical protein
LTDGRSLEEIAYKILNNEDLTKIEGSLDTDKFSLRYKKDLSKISGDLRNLIMIDDTDHFVLNPKQEEHVLFLGKTFKHFEKFSDAKIASGEYVPRSVGEWSFAQKKLSILSGAFNEAYLETELGGVSWSEAIKNQEKLLDFSSGEWNDYTRSMYRKSLTHKPLESSSCFELFNSFVAGAF